MTLTGFHTLIILSLCWFASLIFRDKDKPKFFLAVLIIALVLAFTGLGSGETTSSETKNWQTPETHLAALVYEIGSPKAYGQIPQSERKAYSYYQAGKYKKALKIAKPAAAAGEPLSQYVLAEMYFFGHGVKKDIKKSMHYFRLAANNGHISSQEALGRILFKGESVPRDDERAFVWNKLAAYNGNPLAQHTLGLQYYLGVGTTKECYASPPMRPTND